MAKKMAKLDEERAFRPFKFRIQPFTNSFQDACRDAGMSEAEVAPKVVSRESRLDSAPQTTSASADLIVDGVQVKQYLWNQPLISRFNDEGKKSK